MRALVDHIIARGRDAHPSAGRAARAIGVLLGCAGLLARLPIRINLSPSMPAGVYWIASGPERVPTQRVVRGDIVTVCLPTTVAAMGTARGYLPRHGRCADGQSPVGKPVVAVGGDVVTVDSNGVVVNGQRIPQSAALSQDKVGRALARVPNGRYPVLTGQAWLVSAYSGRSWDSRYWGPIGIEGQTTILRPVWTTGGVRSTPLDERGIAMERRPPVPDRQVVRAGACAGGAAPVSVDTSGLVAGFAGRTVGRPPRKRTGILAVLR